MNKKTKIYTKTGDKGTTALIGGNRVEKNNIRIEAYGSVDELISYIGLIRSQKINAHNKKVLLQIQNVLFSAGAILACDKKEILIKLPEVKNEDIKLLENEIDLINESLPELKAFIIPGGNTIVSFCHIARCICRRTERIITAFSMKHEVENNILIYFNRLSDYLFILARKLSIDNKTPEIYWKS